MLQINTEFELGQIVYTPQEKKKTGIYEPEQAIVFEIGLNTYGNVMFHLTPCEGSFVHKLQMITVNITGIFCTHDECLKCCEDINKENYEGEK
jgi:hypothetical protein